MIATRVVWPGYRIRLTVCLPLKGRAAIEVYEGVQELAFALSIGSCRVVQCPMHLFRLPDDQVIDV